MKDNVAKETLRQMREAIRSQNGSLRDTSPYGAGLTLFLNHEFEKAANLFEQATRLNPDFAFAYYYAGRSYRGLGRYSEAKAMLERSANLNPFHASSHAYLGDILLKEDKLAEAEECFREAIRLQFDNQTALKGLAQLAKQRQVEIEPVAEILRNAYLQGVRNPLFLMELFSLQAPDLEFCLTLAEEQFGKGSFHRAGFFYRLALDREPNNETIHARYRECLEKPQHTSLQI